MGTKQLLVLPPYLGLDWTAQSSGLIGWTFDPALATQPNASPLGPGILYLQGVQVRTATPTTSMFLQQVGAGTLMTAGQNFFGLFNAAGTLIATTADLSGSFGAANTLLNPSWTAPVALTPGRYWIGLLFNSTGTPPTFRTGMSSVSLSFASSVNANLNPATARFATNGAGLTSMPSSITPATNLVNATVLSWWAALR